jgi:hypothetical protein
VSDAIDKCPSCGRPKAGSLESVGNPDFCWKTDRYCTEYERDTKPFRERIVALESELAGLRLEVEAMHLVAEWTRGNKYRSISGPHWNFCDFEMWVRFERNFEGWESGNDEPEREWVVNAASPGECFAMAARKLGLLPGAEKAGGT